VDARWERLFADLEGQLAGGPDEDEIPDLVEAERVAVRVADRVRGRLGARLDVVLRSGTRIGGEVVDAGTNWFAVRSDAGFSVVAEEAVIACGPLGVAVPEEAVGRSLAGVLRSLARAGSPVVVDAGGMHLTGRIAAVGADHCDLRRENGSLLSIRLAAIDLVRWPGGGTLPA